MNWAMTLREQYLQRLEYVNNCRIDFPRVRQLRALLAAISHAESKKRGEK